MKRWAWVWLGFLALLGWAPSLLVAYFVAVALALGHRGQGLPVLTAIYAGLLAFCLVLLVQVRKFSGLKGSKRKWFTWAGGGALLLTWSGAYLAVGRFVGWL